MDCRVKIDKSGRIVVPVNFRKSLKIKTGDEFLFRLEDDSIRLIPIQQTVKLAQKSVKRYSTKGQSLVDELIKTRREDAANE
jgi:AbrB family looped-hinge helix DNA binding protein